MKKIVLLILVLSGFNYAQAQNTQWYPLAQGTDSMVTTIATYDSIIYISGPFNGAFGYVANGFGMYDETRKHGINPGSGFTNGYANSFVNYNGIEYAGGTFKNYFSQFNFLTKTWDSTALLYSPVIKLDTFQSNIVVATDSFVMLYDTNTHQLTPLPQNFKGLLTDITIYQDKIWVTAYSNSADTLSKVYTWDGTTVGDSTLPNKGVKCLYSDGNFLFVSGREIAGGEGTDVAIYKGGSLSDLSNNWSFALFNVGYATSISGNLTSGYIFAGSFVLTDGDSKYHPAAFYQNGIATVLGDNIAGTATGACLTADGKFILAGHFSVADSSNPYNVVVLGPSSSAGIDEIKESYLTLYPNPFHDSFIIKNMEPNSTYRLFDELGRLITVIKAAGSEFIFQDAQLPAGIYFLNDIANPENVLKIVKQ